MRTSTNRAPVILFTLVALYIVLQFLWWAWSLVNKDGELQQLQQQLLGEGVLPVVPLEQPGHTFRMVVGEGAVFILLLLLALWITFRSVRHELELARQQRDFLLAANHELRTPLAALKLQLQTMGRSGLADQQRADLGASALGEVDRLAALTEKILMATRLDEAGSLLQITAFNAAAVLREASALATRTYASGHEVQLTGPADLIMKADEVAFRSVVGNLLENASKYAPAGTPIRVSLRSDHGAVALEVSDEGPGVPEEERTAIFRKFHRVGAEETRGTKGTGLGLYIVKRIMEAHGGRIEYRPRAPHGSIFAATFPPR
jgi:signal transduction histidine kinase